MHIFNIQPFAIVDCRQLSRSSNMTLFLAIGIIYRNYLKIWFSATRKLFKTDDRKWLNINNIEPFTIVGFQGFGAVEMRHSEFKRL